MACDLIVGHNDLMIGLILQLGQTIIKAKKCVDITAGKHFSAIFQTLPSQISNVGHDLEKRFKVKLLVCKKTL